ncbi:AAA family ATPase [uncultured Psychrobacter sp.]|uniref:AAA family ATPase n=1 Tax=uncultured Psychrobacter sp. TaxID=259303 RepID=UPI003459F0E5
MATKKVDRTLLKSMTVKNFRNMKDIDFEFGERITVISGKNGTAKSTILGLVAQIFNFEKDVVGNKDLDFRTLNNKIFKSQFKDHFRLSNQFDKPGEMDIRYNVYDAYFKKDIADLKLTMTATKGRPHRTVVRNNLPTEHSNNTSRNVTHPVIYLSLKRLLPIAERTDDSVDNISYLQSNSDEFIRYCNEIIGKNTGTNITSTTGVVDSSVVHGSNYDHQSVSTGEDNVGQIVQALFSFKKLKEEYSDYHGGLLVIDEVDAGLFPYAQNKIIDILKHFSRKYDIQIILSTHSPIIIENIFNQSIKSKANFRNIFLTSAFGKLEIKEDYSWSKIYNDLMVKTNKVSDGLNLPKVNIYFEDKEAIALFDRLITSRKIRRVINILKDVSMGCGMYTTLIKSKVPEFASKSILVLDADVDINTSKYSNVILLPSSQPPDRILFHFLLSLKADDEFWKNDIQFTKDVFNNCNNVHTIVSRLKINEHTDLQSFDDKVEAELIEKSNNGLRELFKGFYKDNDIQSLFNSVKTNPFEYYLKHNPDLRRQFEQDFIEKLSRVLTEGLGSPTTEVSVYLST